METPPESSFIRSNLPSIPRTDRRLNFSAIDSRASGGSEEFQLRRGRYRSRLARSDSESEDDSDAQYTPEEGEEEGGYGQREGELGASAFSGPLNNTRTQRGVDAQRLWNDSHSGNEEEEEGGEEDYSLQERTEEDSDFQMFSSMRLHSSRSLSHTHSAQRQTLDTLAEWTAAFEANNASVMALQRDTLLLQELERAQAAEQTRREARKKERKARRRARARESDDDDGDNDDAEEKSDEEDESEAAQREKDAEKKQEVLRRAQEGDSELVFQARLQSLRALTKELKDTDWMFSTHRW